MRQANLFHQLRVRIGGTQAGEWQAVAALGTAIAADHGQFHILAIERRLGQEPAQVFQRAHRLAFLATQGHGAHGFATIQTGVGRQAGCRRAADDGCRLAHADPVNAGIQQDSKQQIGQRASSNNGRARAQRLRVEGQMALALGHRRLALIEHAHVSAQRNGTDDKLGARVFALPAQQGLAKTDGETQHFHAAGNRHAVVAVLVHGDQDGQCNDECNNGQHCSGPCYQNHDSTEACECPLTGADGRSRLRRKSALRHRVPARHQCCLATVAACQRAPAR